MKKVFYHNKYFNINKLCVLWGKTKKKFYTTATNWFLHNYIKNVQKIIPLDPEIYHILYIILY